jgi:hypothetical protein
LFSEERDGVREELLVHSREEHCMLEVRQGCGKRNWYKHVVLVSTCSKFCEERKGVIIIFVRKVLSLSYASDWFSESENSQVRISKW